MAVRQCDGTCGRLISVAARSGPNPVALADPEHWAVEYVICPACRRSWCDRCRDGLADAGRCPYDGKPLRREKAGDGDGSSDTPAWRRWLGLGR